MGSFQVGIVGGSQSGKTLYLSCLPKFIEKDERLNEDNITFQGADNKSIRWLSNHRNELDMGYVSAGGTTKEEELSFCLTDGNLNGLINVIDRKGSDYQGFAASDFPALIEYLSLCTGFVILVDPLIPLYKQSQYFRPLFENLFLSIINKKTTLNKRFSICLTKIDDPIFWNWYLHNKDKSFLNAKSQEERVRNIFKKWAEKENGEDFTDLLENKFGYQTNKNFRYYLISSIGFFKVDENTYSTNLATLLDEEGNETHRLRNGMHYSPVNLYNPLFWAMGGNRRLWK